MAGTHVHGSARREVEFDDYEGVRHRRVVVLEEPPLALFGGRDGAQGLQRILHEASDVLDMGLVLLGHVNASRYTVVALYARDPRYALSKGDVIPIVETYCRQEITWERPFVLGDALLHPAFSEHPGYTKHSLRAYAGAPIILPDGTVFGTLCGVDGDAKHPSLAAVERLLELAEQAGEEIWRRLQAAPEARQQQQQHA